MQQIGAWLDTVVVNIDDDGVLARVAGEVREFSRQFPAPPWFRVEENQLIWCIFKNTCYVGALFFSVQQKSLRVDFSLRSKWPKGSEVGELS